MISCMLTGPIYQTLIPSRPSTGCPSGTIDGMTTCFCEDHCSWNVCRMSDPPIFCPSVESWKWNPLGRYWVAQGKYISLLTSYYYHTFEHIKKIFDHENDTKLPSLYL